LHSDVLRCKFALFLMSPLMVCDVMIIGSGFGFDGTTAAMP